MVIFRVFQLTVPIGDGAGETVTFRKLLLNRCQMEFEKDQLIEIDLGKMQLRIEEAETVRDVYSFCGCSLPFFIFIKEWCQQDIHLLI